ncbi:MAG: hypothetical protein CL677_03465 [Bdellovibrionaceae bacterium]|nr:hypothetical protein [Pseudobdellovibrionaceae bacterium]|tara:strand:+ start:112856 stop:113908 length:1053 start_codon:yes stop_codon:yes gene_type:complete
MRTLTLVAVVIATLSANAQDSEIVVTDVSASSEIAADAGTPLGTSAPTGLEDLDLSDIEAELGQQINVNPSDTEILNPSLSDTEVILPENEVLPTESVTAPTESPFEDTPASFASPVITPATNDSLIPNQPGLEVVAEPIAVSSEIREDFEGYEPENFNHRFYVNGIFGGTGYNADNVESDATLGLAVGYNTEDNTIVIEGALTSGRFFIEDANPYNRYMAIDSMQQYNFTMAVKAPLFYGKIMGGRIQPYVGALVGYTYREFSEQSVNSALFGRGDWESEAMDMGALIEADFHVNKTFSLGLSYRYMFNVSSNRRDSEFYDTINGETIRIKPIEETDYYLMSLNGKFKF